MMAKEAAEAEIKWLSSGGRGREAEVEAEAANTKKEKQSRSSAEGAIMVCSESEFKRSEERRGRERVSSPV